MPSFSHLKMTSERSKRRGLLSCIFINKLISKKLLIKLIYQGQTYTNKLDIANQFNNFFFINIGPRMASHLKTQNLNSDVFFTTKFLIKFHFITC